MSEGHKCPICDEPMAAETVRSTNVNIGENTDVWHCRNPFCNDALKDRFGRGNVDLANPYLIRHRKIKDPDEKYDGYLTVSVGRIGNEMARFHFCPICDNPVELLDSVYYIWNCPNCLLLRSGGMIERYYPIKEDGTADLDNEVVSQRRGVPLWDPFAPPEPDDEDEEEEEWTDDEEEEE